jgi:hypothetical protein
MTGVSGHLFITRGDLTKLACDGWLMPTGYELMVEDYWLKPEPDGFRSAIEKMNKSLGEDWRKGEKRVLPVPFWHNNRSRPWLVNIIYKRMDRLIESVEEFVETVLQSASTPVNGRERHLLALPVISTGFGGGVGDGLPIARCGVLPVRRFPTPARGPSRDPPPHRRPPLQSSETASPP